MGIISGSEVVGKLWKGICQKRREIANHRFWKYKKSKPCKCGCGKLTMYGYTNGHDPVRNAKIKEWHRKNNTAEKMRQRFLEDNPNNYKEVIQKKSGSNNGRWKNGSRITNGYREIKVLKHHPRKNQCNYVKEHVLVMEKKIGRFLKNEESVHHIDHNKLNNDINNLILCDTFSEHLKKYHSKRH